MGKTRNTGKLATQIQFDNSNNLVIGNSTSSSFNTSGSVNAIGGITGSIFGIGDPTSFSASISSNLVSIQSVTASNIARLSNLETKSSSVDISVSSINTFTSSNGNTSLNSKTGSYATTGSNTFFGTQTYSGSVFIANDLIVQGSSSIQYISASSVSIGTNIVQLNTANPSVRFAGLTVIDSGSVGGSGSFLYDSLQDEFIFVHRGNGTNVTSSHFVLGPETYDSLGNETYLTSNIITKGTGKEHLVDSCIFDNGTTVCIKNNLIGTGTISGTTIYGSTITCSPIGCFATSCATSFIGGSITGTLATFGADVVGDPVYLRIQNYNTGGYPSSLALSIYGYDSSPAGYYDQFRIRATYPGYGATDFIVKEQAQSSEVIALTIRGTGISCFSKAVCACLFTAPTISAGIPTNSRIVANASTIYGYYDVEVNPRWTLGRDVWAGGSGGLAFGVGGTTTCYSMIGDPSGYGCTIAFATLVPTGCSGTTYERMRIISNGNVGISTSSPNYANLVICNAAVNSGNNSALTIGRVTSLPSSAADYGNIFLFSTDAYAADKGGTISFGSQYGSSGGETRMSGIFGGKENATNGDYSGYLSFYTRLSGNQPAERMRITSGGNVGVAITSPKAVFDVGSGNAHGIISTWCKGATSNTMYNAFDIHMDEASFAGTLYVEGSGAGLAIQAIYDVLSSYDRLCIIPRSSMTRGQGETLTIPNYAVGGGSKRICIQQNNTSNTSMTISAMLVGTAYGGTYICAQA